MNHSDLLSAVYQMAQEGTKVALVRSGLVSPVVSQSEAYIIYTENTIKRLKSKKLITPRKYGAYTSKVMYEREEIAKAILEEFRGSDNIIVCPGRDKGKVPNKPTLIPDSQ